MAGSRTLRPPRLGTHPAHNSRVRLTRRWRGMDSNFRFRMRCMGGLRRLSPASAASRRGSFFATAVGGHHRRRAKAKSRNRSLLIARGTGSSNSFPSTRDSGEVGGSSGSVAHRYLQLHAIVRTQLGGPPTVAGFKALILRLQPRAETMRPEGVRRPHGIVHEELPFRDGLG
jgi:hypothetical protein